jgi:hypothetical protein
MTGVDVLALRLLDRLERQEANSLAWGFAEGSFSHDDLLRHADHVLATADHPETGKPHDLLDWLVDHRLLFELPFDTGRHRTRFAETVRLLFRLRQLLPNHPFATAPTLVADYRLAIRPRRFPDFKMRPPDVLERVVREGRWEAVEQTTLRALLERDGERKLAGFQLAGLLAVRRHLATAVSNGTIITAGTGSGKTLAAYLPALVEAARLVERGHFWTKVLCLYPRNELLKDQLHKVMQETERLQAAGLKRPVRVGAFFHSTPHSARFAEQTEGWEQRAGGLICPYLRCPRCGGGMRWHDEDRKADRERLDCLRCGSALEEGRVALTRTRMQMQPPDVLFSSTESLNRQLASSSYQGIFGVGRPAVETPRLVLLDEVHTYDGVPGAQVALVLRRWRHGVANRPVQWVGLSATLRNPTEFFAELTGLPRERIAHLDPSGGEVESGMEYLLAVRGDPASRRSLLSTTIQTSMLLGRSLDPQPANPGQQFQPPSAGVQGQRAFVFSDDLDVINRLYHDLLSAEAYGPRYGWKEPLANLRGRQLPDPEGRDRLGQTWWLAEEIGHPLQGRAGVLRVSRTTAQDRGVDDLSNLIVCSSALEVGFDDEQVGAVLQHKAPHSLASFLQRKGRAGRKRRMRPWTLLVLSDYGRDRLAYQAPEQLFDPTLPRRTLPVRNRYVLRIQAVYAFMDWVALMARRQGHRFGVWTIFTEPASTPINRGYQAWGADLVQQVLDQPDQAAALGRHLEIALRIAPDEVARLLWEPPRPLMTAVLPTLLRRLRTGWTAHQPDGSRGTDVVQSFNPLPEFAPANLFSDLQLPELAIELPVHSGPPMPERMPLLQGMQTFAPGRASRRFATDRQAELAHWVPITGEAELRLPVDRFCPNRLQLGSFTYRERDGEVRGVPCYRPLKYVTELCDEEQISVSSMAFLRWHSQLFAVNPGLLLRLPSSGGWRAFGPSLELCTHTRACPVTVRRFSTAADADFRRKGEEPVPCTILFTEEDPEQAAALGFELQVDGLRLRYRLPEGLTAERLQTPAALREHRTLFFRHLVQTDPALLSLANHFMLQWLAEIHLAALIGVAASSGHGLVEAAEELAADYVRLTNVVMDDVLQMIGEEGEEVDEASLRAQLEARFNNPDVRRHLRHWEAVLWQPPAEAMRVWLLNRLETTLGAAFLHACYTMARDVDAGDLLLDLRGGCPPNNSPPAAENEGEIWITEASPGGCGVIEAIGRAIQDSPAQFLAALDDALAAGEFELIDRQLTRLLGTLQDPAARLSVLAADVRAARSQEELAAARDAFLPELSAEGHVLSRPFLVAVNARLLPPDSGPERDRLLYELLAFRDGLEERLGVEVGPRELAWVAAGDEAIRQAVARATGMEPEGYHLFRIIAGLPWPRASLVRTTALTAYNPFAPQLPVDRCLLRRALGWEQAVVDIEHSNWREELQQRLADGGEAVLRVPWVDRARLRGLMLELTGVPLDVGYLQVHPRIRGLTLEDGAGYLALQSPEVLT